MKKLFLVLLILLLCVFFVNARSDRSYLITNEVNYLINAENDTFWYNDTGIIRSYNDMPVNVHNTLTSNNLITDWIEVGLINLNGTSINDWSEIVSPSYWKPATAVGSIWYNATNYKVGIGKEPTVELDVKGEIKSNSKTTTQKFYSVGEAGFHKDYVNSVALSLKPYVSSGAGGLRIYDYLGSKYAEIGLGASGTDRFLNIWIDGTQMFQIHKQNSLTRAYSALTSSRYYAYGFDYGFNLNSQNIGLGYSTRTCRRGELALVPSVYTYLVNTDGTNCLVTLGDISSENLENFVFNVKNIDPDYNLTLVTKSAVETIDYTYNNSYGLNMKYLDNYQFHITRDTYLIIGEVN